MSTLLIAVALTAAAVVVALVLRRRRPAPPTQPRWTIPTQLDRQEFHGPDIPWLVVVFSSKTCASCEQAMAKARVLASDEVVVQDVSYQTDQRLHQRYGIDAAPTIVVADRQGVVRASFVGAPTSVELWAAMAEARHGGGDPGTGTGAGTAITP
jgi:protein-disulfide isomerase